MFGTYRFILALAVVIEHMLLIKNYHIGACAVIGFYILAGFVMNHSFSKNFNLDIKKIPNFYFDRFLRIYPLYLFIFICGVLFIGVTEPESMIFKISNYLINLTLIPLNFFGFIGDPNYFIFSRKGIPIPPAPSLALEAQFYLCIPFLLYFRRVLYVIYPISFFIFCLAIFNVVDTFYYSYILLPGTLFIFLTGTFLYDYVNNVNKKISKIYLISTCSILFYMLLFFSLKGLRVYTFEIITSIFFSIIIILCLCNIKIQSKLDTFLGNLSYPIFLSHWFIFWIYEYISKIYLFSVPIAGQVLFKILLILIFAVFSYIFIDKKVQKCRKNVQRKLS